MFGEGILREIREANDKLHEELGAINESLDDVNHNLKILIEIEYAKLSKKQQAAVQEKIPTD